MANDYEINALAKEESWRMFRIIGEFVEGFDKLSGIEPAVSVYGSARIRPGNEVYTQTKEIARLLGEVGFSILTGGGPGVMEAANKGALEAGAMSIGLNIELSQEQSPNPFTTKSLSFTHFFVRKVMLVKYVTAFIIMPGGLGTLDELTEVLTLMQTKKIKPFPIVMVGSSYWQGLLNWLKNECLARNFISDEDLNLLRVCDEPETVRDIVQKWYIKHEIGGRRAVAHGSNQA